MLRVSILGLTNKGVSVPNFGKFQTNKKFSTTIFDKPEI